jgi:hypothetical protein
VAARSPSSLPWSRLFPNKCRIQRKNTLQNRGTNPKALRICTNFNSENYINRHPRGNHRLRNFRKNYG